MMNSFVHRIFKSPHPLWDLIVSAVGGFAFIGGLSPLTIGKDGSGTRSSPRADGTSSKPSAGIGAALFLLAFVASEALSMIGAFRH
jgi:hypothetical protein